MKTILRIILTALLLAPLAALHAAEVHVSPSGNDANLGTEAKPLATIQAGANKLQPGDTLLIHGGVYRETVTFPASGTEANPITVKAAPGEKVVITGCDPVAGWALHDKAKNIWKAPMPWTLGTGRNQVFAGDEVLIEARFPNQPAPGLEMPVSGLSKLWPTFGEFANPDPVKQPGRVVGKLLDGQPENYWRGGLYYGIHYGGWSAQTGAIESSKSGEVTVGDRTPTWWSVANNYAADDGRGMIVGHMNALDQPGEWHWQDNTLYLIPLLGTKPGSVEAKRRQLALDLSNREHIRIVGVNLHAASMRMANSAHCVVDRCTLSFISHFTRVYAAGQVEHGRDTKASGETGIVVSGNDNAFLNSTVRYSAGAGIYLSGLRHTVHNCLIDEVDYASHYLYSLHVEPEEDFFFGGHTLTYNTLSNTGRSWYGIPGTSWCGRSRSRSPNLTLASLFAHNHAFNGMLQTRDAGCITGGGSSGGNLNGVRGQILYNVLHDCYDLFGIELSVLGIGYVDLGTCDLDLCRNLLWAAPGSLQRGFYYNTACVNIHEQANVLRTEFDRSCAELRPEDFPEGKPFRFGHDFQNPPPLPKWPQLETTRMEAENSTALSGKATKTPGSVTALKDGDWFAFDKVDLSQGWQSAVLRFASDVPPMNADKSGQEAPRHQKVTDPLVLDCSVLAEKPGYDAASPGILRAWTFARNIRDGGWLRFNQVPLGEGYRRFRAVYGTTSAGPQSFEVRLDKIDGPIIARSALPQTQQTPVGTIGSDAFVHVYGEVVCDLSPEAKGTHDVFVVFRGVQQAPVGEFEYFRFEQYRGQTPLQKNEVKLEIRVGGKDGEKIGEFYPRHTGGLSIYRETVAALESAKLLGPQTLYFVVRSATGKSLGAIDWISLERAKTPLDMTGLGIEPLKRDGQYVFPEPTHRPLPPDVRRLPSRLRQKLEAQKKKEQP